MTSLSDLTLADLDLFEGGAPWHVFDRLRAEAPVHWSAEEKPNHGFWSITEGLAALAHDIPGLLALLGWREPAQTLSSA